MTPSKTDRFDELEELLRAATPLPWSLPDPPDGVGEGEIYGSDGWAVVDSMLFEGDRAERTADWKEPFTRPEGTHLANAALIVAAVNALPALLAERKRLTFADFSATNLARCEAADGFGHPLNGWTLSDWFTAAMGELGEAANKAKKLNRVRDGIPGNTESEEELRAGLADEIADTMIYLDLLAQAAGFDLATAVVSKFNRTSEKIGAPHRLLAGSATPEEEQER